jgi:hypothetical protein
MCDFAGLESELRRRRHTPNTLSSGIGCLDLREQCSLYLFQEEARAELFLNDTARVFREDTAR